LLQFLSLFSLWQVPHSNKIKKLDSKPTIEKVRVGRSRKLNCSFVLKFCLCICVSSLVACTAIIVGRGATVDGSLMTTHNNDCMECDSRLARTDAKVHAPGTMKAVYKYKVWMCYYYCIYASLSNVYYIRFILVHVSLNIRLLTLLTFDMYKNRLTTLTW